MAEQTEDHQNRIEEQFDLTGLLLDYLNHWKWFILSLIICGIAAYYYVSTIIPTYVVSASIFLSDENSSSKKQALLGMSDPMIDMNTYIDETEIEILKSKNNLIKIVDSLNLAYSYYHVGRLRDVPTYHDSAVLAELDSISLRSLQTPVTIFIDSEDDGFRVKTVVNYADGVDEKVTKVKKLPARLELSCGTLTLKPSPFTKKMSGTIKIVINNPDWVAGTLSSSLSIAFAKNTANILGLTLHTPLPDQGRDVLRALIDFYNRQIIEDKNRSAIQTEAFILDRLVMINGELRDVENRLRQYREEHNIANLDAQTTMNISQKNDNEAQLATVGADLEILNDIQKHVATQDNYQPLPTVANNEAVSSSIEAYNKAVSSYQRALETMGKDHPQIAKSEAALIKQKSQILSNIDAARRDMNAHRRSIAAIGARSSGQLAVQPSIDKGLNEIFREQQVKVNIYTFLLQKREEIALQKTLATPTAQFIDNPSGTGPVAPKKSVYIAVGLLIGLLIPALIIFLRRMLFPKFSDKGELERLTKVPILGEICLNDTDEEVVVTENNSSSIAELFRLLRNNINFVGGTKGNQVIMVTSSVSGEGKTFVSLNLAMTFALTGKRTCVVGLDIRRPVLAHVFGMSNAVGVTTFLAGQEKDITKIVQVSPFSNNLYVLPAGPVPPNPNELLLGDNMTLMIEQLRKNFDYIILDTAPIGLVSDSYLIISHSDVQIYVTRAGVSTKKGLKVLHDAINANRLPHPYIVLNGVDVGSTSYIYRRYGYYGYHSRNTYGYAYGYGEGRHRSGKPQSWWQKIFKKKKSKSSRKH